MNGSYGACAPALRPCVLDRPGPARAHPAPHGAEFGLGEGAVGEGVRRGGGRGGAGTVEDEDEDEDEGEGRRQASGGWPW